jgi:hypothetical protein
MLNLLLTTTNAAVHQEYYLTLFNLVYSVGALAAGVVGAIAWYNSKRPVGWEDRARPSFIPSINTEASEEA